MCIRDRPIVMLRPYRGIPYPAQPDPDTMRRGETFCANCRSRAVAHTRTRSRTSRTPCGQPVMSRSLLYM
eukprot:14053948-Alexandrium_andersonii.AAC.1